MSDLTALIESDLGEPVETQGSRSYWLCPFHADRSTPSLTVVPDGDRFKCFGCGRSGGAVVWLMEQRGMPELEAYEEAERLGLADGWDVSRTLLKTARANQWKRRGAKPRREPAKSAPVAHQDVTPPPVAWRERALLFVNYCQEQLHADAGRVALDYLHGRGLADGAIRRWGLGWHSKDRWRDPQQWGLTGKKVWLACGVVIPWTVAGAVWQVKIRRFGDTGPLTKTGSKYAQITQGRPALYGLDFLTGKRVVVICEGELDAVLLWQEAGDLVDVVAIGTKGAKVALPFLAHLAGASRWLVALDNDADTKADEWGYFSPRVRRVRPLQGNDITDFYGAGGDLRAWVTFHLKKLTATRATLNRKTAEKRGDPGLTSPADAQGGPPFDTAKAEELLVRMERGDVEAVAEYGRLAQRLGWPTSYAALPGWDEWGLDVRAWLLDRRVAETDARLQELEGMRQGALL